MEFSENEVEPNGQDLIQQLVTLTGLPEDWAKQELDEVLNHYGQNSKNLTLDQLREVLVAYLEATQAELMADSLAATE
jgi:hypothetical protein